MKLNTKNFRFFTLSVLLLISYPAMVQTQACGSLVSGCCKLTGIVATGCCDASCCLLRAFCCCTLSEEVDYAALTREKSPEERLIDQIYSLKCTINLTKNPHIAQGLRLDLISLENKLHHLRCLKLQKQAEQRAAEKLEQEQAAQARMEPISPVQK